MTIGVESRCDMNGHMALQPCRGRRVACAAATPRWALGEFVRVCQTWCIHVSTLLRSDLDALSPSKAGQSSMESNGGERVPLLAAVGSAKAALASVPPMYAHSSCHWAAQRPTQRFWPTPPAAFPPPLLLRSACSPAHLPRRSCRAQPSNFACPAPAEADWELVSSSSEEGEAGLELQQEAEALAHSFLVGEPSPPRSGSGGSPPASTASGELGLGRGAAGEPAPGSPQRLQRLQLLAAPLPEMVG